MNIQPLNQNMDSLSVLKQFDLDPSDSNILDKIVQHYKDIAGEEYNIKVIFLAALSRRLSKKTRIHLANYSTSGAGKSWVMRKVLKPFREDVEEITKFTEAWLNRSIENFDGKILLWQEINKTDEYGKGSTGQLKILLTDEGISYRFMESKGEGWVPVNKHSSALPVVITTTTRQLNNEDERRFFILNADESDEQTNRIIQQNLAQETSVKLSEQVEQNYEQLKELVRFYNEASKHITDIKIPFANKIFDVIPKYFQMRTDIVKLLQLVRLVAFVHIVNRKIIIKNKNSKQEKYLVAQIEDFNEAMQIASKMFNKAISGLSSGSIQLLEAIRQITIENAEYGYGSIEYPTMKQCKARLNLGPGTFYNYLNPLIEHGYIEKEKSSHSKEYCLKITDSFTEFEKKELQFTQSEFEQWYANEFGNDALLSDFKEIIT